MCLKIVASNFFIIASLMRGTFNPKSKRHFELDCGMLVCKCGPVWLIESLNIIRTVKELNQNYIRIMYFKLMHLFVFFPSF